MTKKMTKGALFLEKLNGDEILQGSFKKDPRAVLKKFGFNVDDLPGEVATLFAGGGIANELNKIIGMSHTDVNDGQQDQLFGSNQK